jgi:hypothetical protein
MINTDPDEDFGLYDIPDDPDSWHLSCDDEMLSYENDTEIDGDDRLDWSYR